MSPSRRPSPARKGENVMRTGMSSLWGPWSVTSRHAEPCPEDVISVSGRVPTPEEAPNEAKRASIQRALEYMGLKGGEKITDITIDRVFIGSCTNGRIEDLRAVAAVAKGRKVAAGVHALVVPGSGLVKQQAEEEGLDRILVEAVEEKEVKKGGIIIPDTAKEKPMESVVVALGTGKVDDNGKKVPFEVKKGDRVLVSKYGGTEIKIDGKEYKIFGSDDLVAILN